MVQQTYSLQGKAQRGRHGCNTSRLGAQVQVGGQVRSLGWGQLLRGGGELKTRFHKQELEGHLCTQVSGLQLVPASHIDGPPSFSEAFHRGTVDILSRTVLSCRVLSYALQDI